MKTLADWIEMYIQTTDPHDTQWWDMYLDEREFWDGFPSIIEALLRRRSVANLHVNTRDKLSNE